MAKRFTDLLQLTTADTDDVLAIVDTSANVTKRITVTDLLKNNVDAIHIKSNAVITAKILDGAVTAAKIEAQQAWQALTLNSPWAWYGSPYATAAYMKDSLGFVHLKGLVKSGANNTTIATLPAGYRPAEQQIFAVYGDATVQRIDVYANGNLQFSGVATSGFTSLQTISFKAEA